MGWINVKRASFGSAQRKVLRMTSQATANTTKRGSSSPYLIPPQISHLIKDRPLLWFEDGAEYEVILGSVFAELDPKGAVEAILVKDVVDYIWEARRMRRLKTAAMHAEIPNVAWKLMGDQYRREHRLDIYEARSDMDMLMRGAAAGEEGYEEPASAAMSSVNITPDVLLYEAYKAGLKTMSAINAELERLERRRDQILRSLREQRAALAAMAKSLVEREEVEAVTVAD